MDDTMTLAQDIETVERWAVVEDEHQAALSRVIEAARRGALWDTLPEAMREHGIPTGDLPVQVGAAIALEVERLKAKVARLRAAQRQIYGMALLIREHGCTPERVHAIFQCIEDTDDQEQTNG